MSLLLVLLLIRTVIMPRCVAFWCRVYVWRHVLCWLRLSGEYGAFFLDVFYCEFEVRKCVCDFVVAVSLFGMMILEVWTYSVVLGVTCMILWCLLMFGESDHMS